MIKKIIIVGLAFSPFLALSHGQTTDDIIDIHSFFDALVTIINYTIPLLISFAAIFFIVGIIKFMGSADDEKKHEEGRKMMIWGIVGIFVIVAVWGFTSILVNTFDLDTAVIDISDLPGL